MMEAVLGISSIRIKVALIALITACAEVFDHEIDMSQSCVVSALMQDCVAEENCDLLLDSVWGGRSR